MITTDEHQTHRPVGVPPASNTITELLNAPLPDARSAGFAGDRVTDPSAGQRRQCYLALRAAHASLLADPRNPGQHVPDVLDRLPGGKQRSDRTRVLLHARTILLHLPAGVRLTGHAVQHALVRLNAAERAMQPGDDLRLFVTDTVGATWAMETHPARRPGGTSDGWMRRRVAAHQVLGTHIPGYAGVLITTPRCDAAAVHVPLSGPRHLLGACTACSPAVTA